MRLIMIVFGLLVWPAAAFAQLTEQRFATQDTVRGESRASWRALRVSKWATLLASAGAAGYGFTQNRAADREYEELERDCADAPLACVRSPDSDSYADAALESRYQRIVERDDRARVALLAGQVGVIASVVLFILDLPENTTPDDIPYDPKPLGFRLGSNGSMQLGFTFAASF